jgi:hypothetical protein
MAVWLENWLSELADGETIRERGTLDQLEDKRLHPCDSSNP